MIDGFVEVSRHCFYVEVWPRIKKRVEAVEGNLEDVKRRLAWAPHPELLIRWGYRDEEGNAPVVLAISLSAVEGGERHWVSPHLLETCGSQAPLPLSR